MTVQELNSVLGNNIRRYRVQKGYGLREFAKKVGVHVTQLNRWEKGRALINGINLVTLAQLFEVEVWELYYPKDIKEEHKAGTEDNKTHES